jgi:putative DNA primase/helicase
MFDPQPQPPAPGAPETTGPALPPHVASRVRSARTAFATTDLGNAMRLVARHGPDLQYCADRRSWLIWDGARWQPDRRGEIQARAIDTVRAIAEEGGAPGGPVRKALAAHATTSQRAERIGAMVRLAQSMLPVTADELDADPWLLTTPSGTLDLRTGALHAHERRDRITRTTRVPYDPHATCPRWERFLREATGGDEELVAYLQRAAGYAATGSTRERAIVVLLGPTASGKTTFLEVLRAALGDYSAVTPTTTLLGGQHGSGIPADVAALAGARLVIASEADDVGPWDAAKLKLLTGGDSLTARHLYGQLFTFTPTHTLLLATNRLPQLGRVDEALLGRLHVVPFAPPDPACPRDQGLRAQLESELPGILAWIVRGALEWGRLGLCPPAAVSAARERYRDDHDPVGAWVRERADLTERTAETRVRDAFEDYLTWCARADEAPVTERSFGVRLADAGLTRRRATHGERRWVGLRLRGAAGDASDASSLPVAETDPLDALFGAEPSVTCVTSGTFAIDRAA